MDCFQSTTCIIVQETSTAVQETGTAVQETGTAVQESVVQEVATQETTLSSADETCVEGEETEEHK